MMRALLISVGAAVLSLGLTAQSGSLFTTSANNGGGALGGAIYFDLAVTNDLTITSLDLNCIGGPRTTVRVYAVPGATHVGNERGGAAFWGSPLATGNITTVQPIGTLSSCPLTLPLTAGAYAVAIVSDAGHAYTNGNGTNQNYSNADLSLMAGSASNIPFAGSVFVPRVWNGRINYTLGASGTIASATKAGSGCGGSALGDATDGGILSQPQTGCPGSRSTGWRWRAPSPISGLPLVMSCCSAIFRSSETVRRSLCDRTSRCQMQNV